MRLRSRCRIPGKSKMEVCVSILNSGKQRYKNVGDANYFPVSIKPCPWGLLTKLLFNWKKQDLSTNPFISCNVSSAAPPIFKQINFFYKSTKKVQIYQSKNTVTKNNKIHLIIMELSNHIIPCQIRIIERNCCFCLVLVYHAWLITFFDF